MNLLFKTISWLLKMREEEFFHSEQFVEVMKELMPQYSSIELQARFKECILASELTRTKLTRSEIACKFFYFHCVYM